MEKRVKIFQSDRADDIEWKINDFFIKTSGKLHEVKYLHFVYHEEDVYSALIIFTPGGNQDEKIESTNQSQKGHGRVQGKIFALGK